MPHVVTHRIERRRRLRSHLVRWPRLLCIAVSALVVTLPSKGHAQFDTVINLPPNISPKSIDSDTQLNVLEGGELDSWYGESFQAGNPDRSSSNVEVNISGGTVGSYFHANSGSQVNISGGIVRSLFNANSGSDVMISGGTIEPRFQARSGSRVTISGGILGARIQDIGIYYDMIYNSFQAHDRSRVTVSGGTFVYGFDAGSGSEVDISGGTFGRAFHADSGSEVNISGGTFGQRFQADDGSQVTLSGGEFLLNGIGPTGAAVTLTGSDVLTGTLEDGSPLIFSPLAGDDLTGILLSDAPLPTLVTTPIVVDSEGAPSGLRAGQTLTLLDGGVLGENFTAVNATLNIHGGHTRGELGGGLEAFGSQVNIAGGAVGRFSAYSGSDVSISAGSVADSFYAGPGSRIAISGGVVGADFHATPESEVTISGGRVGAGLVASSGSQVTISGGEFLLNSSAPVDSTITLTGSDVLTGTLADGSPFIFSPLAGDDVNGAMLTSVPLPPVDTSPIVVDSPNAPSGLRAGQTLTLQEGGVLGDSFAAVNATLHIAGGEVGNGIEVDGSEVHIAAGTVGDSFNAYSGSQVTISGGNVGSRFHAHADSVVTVSGGTVGQHFTANPGSRVTISGGTVDGFTAHEGSVLNMTGGMVWLTLDTFGGVLNLSGGSIGSLFASSGTVNIYGTGFTLDGTEIPVPELGQTTTVMAQDAVLSGLLADGSMFRFNFDTTSDYVESSISPDATLTVTLVSLLPGDYNSNGLVEQEDLDLVLTHWGRELHTPFEAGWLNNLPDGVVDQQELDRVLARWGESAAVLSAPAAAAVPEPTGCILLVVGTSIAWVGHRLSRIGQWFGKSAA